MPGDGRLSPAYRRAVLPVAIVCIVMSLGVLVRTVILAPEYWALWSGAGGACSVLVISITAITLGWLDIRSVLEVAVICVTPCVILLDWHNSHRGLPRAWPLFVLAIDLGLLVEARNFVFMTVIASVHLWLALERADSTFQFGLVDAASTSDGTGHCDCASPPCAQRATEALISFLGFSVVFVGDFVATRGFAVAMRLQIGLVGASVDAAQRISLLMLRYEVDHARELLKKEAGQIPPELISTFEQLLNNLDSYRPYLPDALLQGTEESQDSVCGQDCLSPCRQAPGVGEDQPHASIAFTDVQASTALWEHYNQAMYEALQLHNSVVRGLLKRHGGYEVKTIGDAFMIAFADPESAVRFAVEGQQGLASAAWPADFGDEPLCRRVLAPALQPPLWNGLRVRIGLHSGRVQVDMNPTTMRVDYFGHTVNVAARVEGAVGYGGLIGITAQMLAQVSPPVLATTERRSMGLKALKGVAEATEIHLLVPAGYHGRFEVLEHPPLSVAGASDTSAPASSRASSVLHTDPLPTAPLMKQLHLELRSSWATAVCARVSLADSHSLDVAVPRFVAAVAHSADKSHGVIVSVLSCSVVVTWNALLSCPSHAAQSVKFSRDVHERSVHCSTGVASGTALSGNVAGGRRRFSTAVGGLVELACACAEEAELHGDKVLVCGPAKEEFGMASRAAVWMAGSLTMLVWSVDADQLRLSGSHQDAFLLVREVTGGSRGTVSNVDNALLAAGSAQALHELLASPLGDHLPSLSHRRACGARVWRDLPPLVTDTGDAMGHRTSLGASSVLNRLDITPASNPLAERRSHPRVHPVLFGHE
eukprot:TRINITY_DN535_c3_g1_i1.p1 TRINITY_DN535_c3_g1~~TRINITY_DN535_c3_g1_i1.p1  ORF type:complete len:843 (+),score=259.43 TRINITY_DN535_c3_g1_i1:65-2530(+)